MKKLVLALALFLGIGGTTNAQVKSTTTVKSKTATKKAGQKKTDGSLDMRYKKNKLKASGIKPLKADGTPDKRYNVNKQ